MASQKAVPFILEGIFIRNPVWNIAWLKSCFGIVYILQVLIPYQICDLQISFAGWPFYFVDSVLWCTQIFHFDKLQFIYPFIACAFGVIVKSNGKKISLCVFFYGYIHFIVLVSVSYRLSKAATNHYSNHSLLLMCLWANWGGSANRGLMGLSLILGPLWVQSAHFAWGMFSNWKAGAQEASPLHKNCASAHREVSQSIRLSKRVTWSSPASRVEQHPLPTVRSQHGCRCSILCRVKGWDQ